MSTVPDPIRPHSRFIDPPPGFQPARHRPMPRLDALIRSRRREIGRLLRETEEGLVAPAFRDVAIPRLQEEIAILARRAAEKGGRP